MKSARKKPKQSAGLILYRQSRGRTEVFLVHPGGPFWQKKDDGAWSIPKGEFTDEEDPLDAARREFQEETGQPIPQKSSFRAFRPVHQPGGKIVYAWAVEAEVDAQSVVSNTFSLEWPPHSGKTANFPEIDRAEWFPLDLARRRILKGQLPLLDQLVVLLAPAHPAN